jgi:mycothiol synthase
VAEVDGALAGWVHPEAKALVVEPAHRRRGIGRALVDEGLRIERERGRPELLLGLLPEEPVGHAFVGAAGFAFHSTLWDLDLARDVAVEAPAWPDGVRRRTIDATRDLGPWVDLFNAAFADHPTPLQLDAARIAETWDQFPSRDEDLLLAEDDAGPVGFCSTEPLRRADGGVEPRGEIWTVGVRPDAQGRGLGRALLRWGVHHLRETGVETVTLSVNGRNPRALGLYESEGFRRTATRERWARPVPEEAP